VRYEKPTNGIGLNLSVFWIFARHPSTKYTVLLCDSDKVFQTSKNIKLTICLGRY